jgi:hypothetical protein
LGLVRLPEALEDVLKRTEDIDHTVRIAAFNLITEKIGLNQLPPDACVRLLLSGLKDNENSVFESVIQLLKIWYKQANFNIIKVIPYLFRSEMSVIILNLSSSSSPLHSIF